MLDPEMIKEAKDFIDKLANGENPLDGTPIPDGDLLNDVRIVRKLFSVSRALGEVINDSAPKTENKTRRGFGFTPEVLERFEYSETPIHATELSNRLNALIAGTRSRKFPRQKMYKWLLSIGLLTENEDPMVKKGRVPTKLGEEFGISLEYRTSIHGDYAVVLYDIDAQHFIIDNIEAILYFDPERVSPLAGSTASSDTVGQAKSSEVKVATQPIAPRGEDSKNEAKNVTRPAPSSAEGNAKDAKNVTRPAGFGVEGGASKIKSCLQCKHSRSGECFPQKDVCPEYEDAFSVSDDERADWPDYGDASALRRGERR